MGTNPWLLHTPNAPNDNRTTLYVVPKGANDWNWARQTEFRNNGDLRLPNDLHVLNRVGIGTDPATMGALRLAVEGTIGARAVKVTAVGTAWPDYVFRPGYRLRPLREVGAYAARYHHLPEVPSAAAVQRQGLDLAATDALLLRKVEELTLYLVALERRHEALQLRLRKLELRPTTKRN